MIVPASIQYRMSCLFCLLLWVLATSVLLILAVAFLVTVVLAVVVAMVVAFADAWVNS